METTRKSNPIATDLACLFHAFRNAVAQDEEARFGEDDRANHVAGFIERYQVRFQDLSTMEPLQAGRLLAVLRKVAGQFELEFEYSRPSQLSRRIGNDMEVLAEAGFEIERERNSHTKTFDYEIRKVWGSE